MWCWTFRRRFSGNLGLTFLAHTHIPTIWNAQNVVVENRDWIIEAGGVLRSEWRLPNGIAFGARVTPVTGGADLELWLENGTESRLTALRTQICVMLKAAPGFNEQSQEGKDTPRRSWWSKRGTPTAICSSPSNIAAGSGETRNAPVSIPIPSCPRPRRAGGSRRVAGCGSMKAPH